MALARTCFPVVAVFHQHLCPQGEFWLPPVSPGGYPKPESQSDSVLFQATASVLILRECEICVQFKSGIFVSHRPLPLPNRSPTGLPS